MKKYSIYLLLLVFSFGASAQLHKDKSDQEILEILFKNNYEFWKAMRSEKSGAYCSHMELVGEENTRGSVANAGWGLMSVCVADAMGWEENAEALVIQTLESFAGENPKFDPPVNGTGTFKHFFDVHTGKANGSNYSTIDTDILLAGALFTKRYFYKNKEIKRLVDKLWDSTNQESFIDDYSFKKGGINLILDKEGNQIIEPNGKPKRGIKPYNEYMIIGSLAKNQAIERKLKNSKAVTAWDNTYGDVSSLKTYSYAGQVETLAGGGRDRFPTQFIHIFNYFLCHEFSDSPEYVKYFKNAGAIDRMWWQSLGLKERTPYEFGVSAGAGLTKGYSIDHLGQPRDIHGNPDLIASPNTMAGFSPVFPKMGRALVYVYKNRPRAIYTIPGTDIELLWRYSFRYPDWRAIKIHGVDYSTMIFGMAALPEFLGPEFFNIHNDYFNPEPPVWSKK